MTKGPTKIKRKVTFDVPESDSESDSDSSDNSEDIQIQKSRHKKIWPKESPKKFDPPPLNSDYKLKSILKNKNTLPYEKPAATSSILPLHIINSIINAKFGALSDLYDEESDSGNSSDESETLSSNLYLRTKGNLDVESNNSRQNSFEELNRDDWFKDLPEVESDDNNNISLVDCLIEEQNLNLEKALNKKNSDIPNSDIIPLNSVQNSSSSSDLSESSENSDKPLTKKPRRKLKVIVRSSSGDTDSEETFEVEVRKKLFSLSSSSENQIPVSKTNTLYYNAHQISYLGQQCDDNFDSISVIPEQLSLVSYSDYSNALVRFPPVILQSSNEISEDIKKETELEENNCKNPFFDQIRNQENITSFLEDIVSNIEEEEPFDLDENTKINRNQELPCTNGSSPDILKALSSPHIETDFEHSSTKPSRNTNIETVESIDTQFSERHNRSSGHKRQRSQHRSNKKRVFTAVRLPSESEEPPPTPTKRNIKPYTKKPRKPLLKLVMEYSDSVNCAGEPEVLSPHKRDDIKEKDILIWIYNMIDEPARVDYEFFLKDGCILCKLINRIKPGCIPEEEITWEGARSKQKNVQNFLIQAEEYGVPKAKLFYPEDLLHLRHIPRVTRCIYALAKIAQEDPALGPDCPRLGDEPNFMEPPKKVEIPGHRDTKEVLNQITSTMQKKEEKKATKHSLYK